MLKTIEYRPGKSSYNRRIFTVEWNDHKTRLKQLHEEGLTRKQILVVMAMERDFRPTLSQLNKQFAIWDWKCFGKRSVADQSDSVRIASSATYNVRENATDSASLAASNLDSNDNQFDLLAWHVVPVSTTPIWAGAAEKLIASVRSTEKVLYDGTNGQDRDVTWVYSCTVVLQSFSNYNRHCSLSLQTLPLANSSVGEQAIHMDWPISISYRDGIRLMNQGKQGQATTRLCQTSSKVCSIMTTTSAYLLTELLHIAVSPYWSGYEKFRSATLYFLERVARHSLGPMHPFAQVLHYINKLSYPETFKLKDLLGDTLLQLNLGAHNKISPLYANEVQSSNLEESAISFSHSFNSRLHGYSML